MAYQTNTKFNTYAAKRDSLLNERCVCDTAPGVLSGVHFFPLFFLTDPCCMGVADTPREAGDRIGAVSR